VLKTLSQVRAVFVSEDAAREARAELELNENLADQGASLAVQSALGPMSEDVFLAQLYRRSQLLNDGFQEQILKILSRHEARTSIRSIKFTHGLGNRDENTAASFSTSLIFKSEGDLFRRPHERKLSRKMSVEEFDSLQTQSYQSATASERSFATGFTVAQIPCIFAEGVGNVQVQQAPIKT
jgi:hypothetical protein